MKRIAVVLFMALTLFLYAEDNILSAGIELSENKIAAQASVNLIIDLNILEGWHINSASVMDDYSIPTRVSLTENNDFVLQEINYPEGKLIPISWGGTMSLYESTVRIQAVLASKKDATPGEKELKFVISYQACNDVTCMSPETMTLGLTVTVVAPESKTILENEPEKDVQKISEENTVQNATAILTTESAQVQQTAETAVTRDQEDKKSDPFQNKSLVVILLIVFVMGLALNLTPCVYPLIPITMGYFLAQKEARSPVLLAVMYVLGLAVTYSIIGTLAAFGGSMMGSLLAHPATLIFFAVLMLALSLSMFGLYEFKLPNVLTQAGGGSRSGALGALIMGLTMGIVAAPCVGPFVVSLLGFVAQKGSIFIGFITFFVLALGLGMPYLFLGIFSNKINNLPRSGEWLNGIRIFFGLALIGMSIYFILPLIPGRIGSFILPVYMIAAAVYYGVIDRSGLSVAWFSRLKVILAMIVLAVGILMVKPATHPVEELSWEMYSAPVLETSLSSNAPVIIDFYADWCNPCKELEHITFADPEVQDILEDFIRIKVDLTVVNEETNAIKEQFDIPGVPTIVFYDKDGLEKQELRLNGFEKPQQFMERLKKVLE